MKGPEHYKGHEQSHIKHRLLEAYLEMLFMIIGLKEKRICYVDCFSGPWKESDKDLSGTSIALSLEVMQKCHKSLRQRNRNVEFRALFVEKGKRTYKKLESFLTNHTWDGVETESMNGEFHKLRKEILRWCGNRDFVFFFIDPKGWKNAIEIPTLTPLLQRPHSEFLINFMFDFLVRTHTQKPFQEDMQAIFGEVPNTSGLPPKERESYLLNQYRVTLKNIPQSKSKKLRSAYVTVLDPVKERTKYHLVYLTRHPLGVVKFMDASEKLDVVQKKVRAQTKQKRQFEATGQYDFFPADAHIDLNDASVDVEEVKDYWIESLSTNPRSFGTEELADILEATNWFEDNLQRAFKELQDEGKVVNLDASGKRPKKPVHFEKRESLRRI